MSKHKTTIFIALIIAFFCSTALADGWRTVTPTGTQMVESTINNEACLEVITTSGYWVLPLTKTNQHMITLIENAISTGKTIKLRESSSYTNYSYYAASIPYTKKRIWGVAK